MIFELKKSKHLQWSRVYNTFPWPVVTDVQRKNIEALAQEVYLTREDFPGRTLAELYDPKKMPPELLAAHHALDIAVDALYQKAPFKDSSERLSCLLARYEIMCEEAEHNEIAEKEAKRQKLKESKALKAKEAKEAKEAKAIAALKQDKKQVLEDA